MMKRSRRSLGLLLASLAFSLLVLRATTLPARKATRPEHQSDSAGRAAGVPRSATSTQAAPPSVRRAKPLALVNERERVVFASRAVSMTAVLIVLPMTSDRKTAGPAADESPSFISARRTGWSGCMAYANGCDHLGRPGVERRPQVTYHGQLLLGAIGRLVKQVAYAASLSGDVLCPAASANHHASSLAVDGVRATSDR